MKPKPAHFPVRRYLFCLLFTIITTAAAAQPSNNDCSNAINIAISNNGFGLGKFSSAQVDITAATVQSGETFAPAILVAGLNQKSVWYKFTLPTNRSTRVTLAQPGIDIAAGDVGFAVYKANQCLPGNDSLSTKLTPIATFGNTYHPCADPGTYYVQVSSNKKANGKIYIQLEVSDDAGAQYDHPAGAYDFGVLPEFTTYVDYTVECQSIEDAGEVCSTLADSKSYTKSTWHTFTTPAYFDYIGVLAASPDGGFADGLQTIGYKLYKGNAKTTTVASLTTVTACDSLVSNGYTPGYKIYRCNNLQPNTTYSVQLFFKSTFVNRVRVAVTYNGKMATQGPVPTTSKIAASNKLGVLPVYEPNYTVTNFSDYLACNSQLSQNACGPALPAGGVSYNGSNYNLSTFFTFQLAKSSNIDVYADFFNCGPYPLVRIFNQDVTGNCSSLDTSAAHLVAQFDRAANLTCLPAGKYTMQILGSDAFNTSSLYYGAMGASGSMCLLSNFGAQVTASITVHENATSKYSLAAKDMYEPINYSAGKMQPLANGMQYTTTLDTFGCENTVLPPAAPENCLPDGSKAIYREFVVGDADGDNKADSGVVYLYNTYASANGVIVKHALYKGDAGSIAAANKWYANGDTLKGLVPQTICLDGNPCNGTRVCATPGTYTYVAIGTGALTGIANNPSVQFNIVSTAHKSAATAQNMGSILDTIGSANGTVYSDKDYFSCIDNAVYIDGFAPPDDNNYPSTKVIYRQFYLKKDAIVNICGLYLADCNYYNGQMALFAGKATNGLNTLKHVAFNFCTSETCNPLAAGWYTVVCYASGPTYTNPLKANYGGFGSAVGLFSQFSISVSEACPAPKYNRPYKAAVDTTTGKPFLIDWGTGGRGTTAYPATDSTYTLYTENFNCSVDTPFSKLKITGCDPSVNRITYYVFQLAKESYVQISTGGLWGEVFAGDARKDSAKFLTTAPVQPCVKNDGYIQICRMQPGIYTLVIFAGDAYVGNGCGSVTPNIYVDKVGYSRFDNAKNAYDFGVVPADSAYHNGKPGDVNPLNANRAASNDFFYCTTGAYESDPADGDCGVVYNANIYKTRVNNNLYDETNVPANPYDISKRNLWYTFVVDKPGFVHVKVENKSPAPNKQYQYTFAVYKSDVNGTIPFATVVGTGQVDSTVSQGLAMIDYNARYGSYYCYTIVNEIKFYRDPCTTPGPDRYYVVVTNNNSYPNDVPGMRPNSQVEVSVMIDSINAVPTKFDHYSTAGNIGANLGVGKYTGPADNFSCATADDTDPVKQYYSCASKTLWYKFTTAITGHVRFATKVNGSLRFDGNDMMLFRQLVPGDSTVNGFEYEPYTTVSVDGDTYAEHCISPGTYYFIVTGCDRINEGFEPVIILDEEAGDFCSAPVKASLAGAGSTTATMFVDCHTIGTDYGEFGPNLTCPVGAVTSQYKSSWFRVDIAGKDTLDVTTYLDQQTNASSSDIQYRLMTGDCGAMQEQSCVQDALTQNTYKCLPPGSYFIQVFSPVSKNGIPVTGAINLKLSAKVHADTCAPLQNCLATANFIPQFNCTTDDSVRFVNYSTYGSSIKYQWNFGYNNKTSAAVSPGFFYPALDKEKTYNVTLIAENTSCSKKDTVTIPVTIPARPYVNLGKDISTCNYDTTVVLNATSFSGATYNWQNGTTDPTFTADYKAYNRYYVEVTYNNCKSRDTIDVYINPLQKTVPQPFVVCAGDSVYLSESGGGYYIRDVYKEVAFNWSNGSKDYYIYAKDTGLYWAERSLNGCMVRDSFYVSGGASGVHPLGPDTAICLNKPYVVNATVTNGYNYVWQDGQYRQDYEITQPGTYWVDFTVGNCQFRDSVIVTGSKLGKPSIAGTLAFCQGDSTLLDAGPGYAKYKWSNGDTTRYIYVKAGGNYSVDGFDAGGCSAASPAVVVKANPLPVVKITGGNQLCYADSLVLDAGTGYKTYTWSNGNNAQAITVKVAGKFLVTVTDANNCSAADSVTVKQSSAPVKVNINAFICSGKNYQLPSGRVVNIAGIYNDTVSNKQGCDSLIATINLAVNNPVYIDTAATICDGSAFIMPSGKRFTATGTYTDTLLNAGGCDSIITKLNLQVIHVTKSTLSVAVCAGESYRLPSGRLVTTGGSYLDTLHTLAGCDSAIYTINLAVITPVITNSAVTVCNGKQFTLPSGKVASISGLYRDTVKSVSGCDSLISNITVTVTQPAVVLQETATICAGRSYTLPSGRVITDEGTYMDTVKGIAGCDSIIRAVFLSVTRPIQSSLSATVCMGNVYTLPSGKKVSVTGLYSDTLRYTSTGCDSIIYSIDFKVLQPVKNSISITICNGQSYTLPSGAVVSTAGTYYDTVKSSIGCDSILTSLQLSTFTAVINNIQQVICQGSTYTLPSGRVLTVAGNYTDVVQSTAGCDSVITNLILQVKAPVITGNSATICSGSTYMLPSGRVVNTAGYYRDTIHSSLGCDSIITNVNLVVTPPPVFSSAAAICAGQSYAMPSGRKVNTTGTYTDTVHTAAGCDSLVIVHLTVSPGVPLYTSASICAGSSYTLPSGKIVSAAGMYTDSFSTAAGCDSIIITNLQVIVPKIAARTATICVGDQYRLSWGLVVNAAGVYNDTIRNINGCDSVINTVTVTVRDRPVISVSKTNDVDCVMGTAQLTASGAAKYSWKPANSLNNAALYNPVASPAQTTVYYVTATSSTGCIVTDSIEVKVLASVVNGFEVATAFTPNGDGINDCFDVRSWGHVTNLDLKVFDRMGYLLFHTTNPSGCWDGTYKGRALQGGTYVYQVSANTNCGRVLRKGTVVLIR